MIINKLFVIYILTSIFWLSQTKDWILNIKHNIRNNTLRYIIFKQSKVVHFLKNIQQTTKLYYNKTIVTISEGIEKYNNLSDEDKIIIDTICDLIL